MKPSKLRDAICIGLFSAIASPAVVAAADQPLAQEAAGPAVVASQQGDASSDPAQEGTARDAEAPASASVADAGGEVELTELESVTVTGTRIRGGTSPSPVIAITSERIREEGFADLGEVIRSVPQNFGGGQNPGVVTATASGNIANQNGSGGSALNLRGIGPDATLTLLNGRRLAYGGFAQAVDISAIPLEAVDRIEIVADGASAIYGSDAVAGVGNVILKRNYDGMALDARYGRATDGGLGTTEFSITGGATWSGGSVLAAYNDASGDPIGVDERSYTAHMEMPFFLYPERTLESGLISGYQLLGNAELRLDAFRNRRTQVDYQNFSGTFYQNKMRTTATLVAPSVEFSLPAEWSLVAAASTARDENLGDAWMLLAPGEAALHVAASCWCNDSDSYELSAEGPLFESTAGQARLAAGIGYRSNELLNENYLAGRKLGGTEGSRFAYAELSLPLLPGLAPRHAADRLTITAAARTESYDSFGDVTTPKLGVVYRPTPDLTFKASWGRSFKAPTLSSRYGSRVVYLVNPSAIGGVGYGPDDAVLLSWGSSADLRPERARTSSASLAFHPRGVPGMDMELTVFDIDYGDRVVQPFAAFGQILANDAVAEFIDWSPTAEKQAEIIAEYATNGFLNQTGRPYDPDAVVAIGRGEFTNAMRQRIRGLDLSGGYRVELGRGSLALRGAASWMESEQRNTPGQEAVELAGTIFYPAKRRARLGGVWTSGAFTATLFSDYRSGVAHHVTGKKGASFTTFDSTVRYLMPSARRMWPELELGLAVQNLLDRPPPLYVPVVGTDVPYDSTNYSAIGRFVSASISMRW